MVQDLGYTKGPDGMFRAADGTPLSVSIKTHTQNTFHEPGTLSVARYWKNLGVDVQVEVRNAEAALDLPWRFEYPGFFFVVRGLRIDHPEQNFARKTIPTFDNHYSGGNTARVGSAQIDTTLDTYIKTIPFNDRMKPLVELVHQQSDQVDMMPFFWTGAAYVVSWNRVRNVNAGTSGTGQQWNSQLWDLACRCV